MNRRRFLASLAAAVTGAAAFERDPERALWVPGRKIYSIPKPRGGNRFLTSEEFAAAILKAFREHYLASAQFRAFLRHDIRFLEEPRWSRAD